jgi:glyceraldehyde 3-phosphate dehydrogenase
MIYYINMKQTRIAINGFGRIGRAFLRQIHQNPALSVVAINDLGSTQSLAYLLKYDSVYGTAPFSVSADGENALSIDSVSVPVMHCKDPAELPWGTMDIDIVLECTGLFTTYDKANAHITAGAKRVVISAPSKTGEDATIEGQMIVMGINESQFGTCNITGNASCTTNASTPIISVLDAGVGIAKAMLNTVHGYTGTQALVDGPSKKDLREGRAAAQNIVPSSTGAATAVGQIYPSLSGKFDGVSMRVPVIVGSIVDITFISNRDTSVDEINALLTDASHTMQWQKLLQVTSEPLVSSDIQGTLVPCIVDLAMTRVVDGNLVKVLAWYDNEYGYTSTLVQHCEAVAKTLL